MNFYEKYIHVNVRDPDGRKVYTVPQWFNIIPMFGVMTLLVKFTSLFLNGSAKHFGVGF